jgi:Pvc16 N-terminal domain
MALAVLEQDQSGHTMPDSGVVAAVSETLLSVLINAVKPLDNPAPTAELSDLQGKISSSPARLTVFLFEVGEDPSARNRARVRGVAGANLTLSKPPMALVLRYLLTAWGGDRITEHRLLGRAMQVLYDGALISGPDLKGASLLGSNETLKVTLSPLSLENLTRVFWSVQQPYRLSLSYEIRVANLDSEVSQIRPPVRTAGTGLGTWAPSA